MASLLPIPLTSAPSNASLLNSVSISCSQRQSGLIPQPLVVDCRRPFRWASRSGYFMLNFFTPRSGSVKDDVLSGLTVALALVPEAIAFAFVAGVSPLIGLYSAFFIFNTLRAI